MSPDPVSLILAAGASARFGGRSKALVKIGEEPAVVRLVRLSREEGFVPRIVVGAHAPAIRAVLTSPFPEVIENKAWASGRTGSIQKGLEEVGALTRVLLWPVDHPFVQAMTLRRLRTVADRETMGIWFIPTFEGVGGHPVLLEPSVLPRLRLLGPSVPLRTLLPVFGPQVVRVPVDDPGVRANIDTEEEFRRYQAQFDSTERRL
ncbi:MAG: NTP transferase domain-containing protein [Thermoplasmata archaeon]|nr:NTP transferase domain-containing protein [Thermoplasmata archaeon]